MVTPALREVMRAAQGAGELAGDDVARGRAEHPVCGDVVELTWRMRDGVFLESAWRASGCPATLAVAAVAYEILPGLKPAEVGAALHARLEQLGGLGRHEQHAEAMWLRALGDEGSA